MYSFFETSYGLAILGNTALGISYLAFGDDQNEMLVEARKRYPDNMMDVERRLLKPALGEIPSNWPMSWRTNLLSAWQQIEDPRLAFDFMLCPEGTDFQNRVWQILLRIPSGTTITYGEIAGMLDRSAAKAVAQACKMNPIAVLIPCHRVVGGQGLGGYRWGMEMKRELLLRETRTSN